MSQLKGPAALGPFHTVLPCGFGTSLFFFGIVVPVIWAVEAVISGIVSFEETNNSKFWGIFSRKIFRGAKVRLGESLKNDGSVKSVAKL